MQVAGAGRMLSKSEAQSGSPRAGEAWLLVGDLFGVLLSSQLSRGWFCCGSMLESGRGFFGKVVLGDLGIDKNPADAIAYRASWTPKTPRHCRHTT
jgi:hypothetical protein